MEASQNSQNGQSESGSRPPAGSWGPTASDMQRPRSPDEMQKMTVCHNGQCGIYEGVPVPVPVANGHCQQSSHGRLYPASYVQQQQQPHAMMAFRTVHQHHHHYHHPGSIPGCHPHPHHQNPSYVAAVSGAVGHHHMDRMMPGTQSVAGVQQIRSAVMNHYSSNPVGYPYPHHAPTSTSNYYAQAQAVTSGGGMSANISRVEYSQHHHNHLGHAVPITNSHSTAQYVQQQRTAIPVSSGGSYGTSYSKVMNTNQAALYQNAYHQYTQYIQQQHGLVHSHPNGPTNSSVQEQGVLINHPRGVVYSPPHQNSRLQNYMSRTGQPIPQQNNHVHSSACHPQCLHMAPPPQGSSTQQASNQQPQQVPMQSTNESTSETSTYSDGLDKSRNSDAESKSKPLELKNRLDRSSEHETSSTSQESEARKLRSSGDSSMRSSIKTRCASPPEKLIKIKASKSTTKLRDRQPKLLVAGKKKKSSGSLVANNGKKAKSFTKSSMSMDRVDSESENESSTLVNVLSANNVVLNCACVESLCPTRPPPGFEHLIRPAFPIERYDHSLLGNLIGKELLAALPCCENDMDALCEARKSLKLDLDEQKTEDGVGDDWESLNKAIRNVIDDWTEELHILNTFDPIIKDEQILRNLLGHILGTKNV